jgi:ketopantoate reductase
MVDCTSVKASAKFAGSSSVAQPVAELADREAGRAQEWDIRNGVIIRKAQ